MKSFWEYIKEEQMPPNPVVPTEAAPSATPPVQSPEIAAVPQPETTNFKPKLRPWKAKKSEIVRFWKALSPNIPLQLIPIDSFHKGSTVQEDTLRITGSKEFITTVLSRLKDFIIYENPDTKLVLDYRQNQKSLKPGGKNSYLFYLNVRKRK